MHSEIEDLITSSIGNGNLKLITGLAGTGKTYFLFHELFDRFKSNPDYTVVDTLGHDQEQLESLLSSCREADGKRFIILIDDIFAKDDPASLFDLSAGKSNIDVIATTDFTSKYMLVDDETLIRGRFQNIYFPPVSFSEALSLGNVKDFKEYCQKGGLFIPKEECIKKIIKQGRAIKKFRGDYSEKIIGLLNLMLRHCDKSISFTELQRLSETKLSTHTLIDYFNFLEGSNLFYVMKKEGINEEKNKAYCVVFYPTDISFLPDDASFEIKEKSALIAKLYGDSYSITSGYEKQLDVSYVLRKGNEKVYVSYSGFDGSKEAGVMADVIKDSYPKVVVSSIVAKKWIDEKGIIHAGLDEILKYGLKSVLNF